VVCAATNPNKKAEPSKSNPSAVRPFFQE